MLRVSRITPLCVPRRPTGTVQFGNRLRMETRKVRSLKAASPKLAATRPTSAAQASSSAASQLSFDDISQSFKVKSDAEIARALLVFKLCSIPPLVKNAKALLNLSERVLGTRLWKTLLKQTFFGHFCAGETAEEVHKVTAWLEKSGLGAVLDYAAEADVPEPQKRDREGIVSARTYDYEGEASCDANAKICLSCIETAGGAPKGFAAIKVTALGKPEFLEHLSKIIIETARLYRMFSFENLYGKGGSSSVGTEDPTLYRYLERKIGYDDFKKGLRAINIDLGEEKTRRLFEKIDEDRSGSIDYLEWINFLDPRLLGGLNPKFHSQGLPTLSAEEMGQLEAMISRLEMLAKAAAKHKVRLMVDAEQTYFQPAIDHMVFHLQRKYNRTFPAIYGTYQCYLKDTQTRLAVDLERAKREKFIFAAKIVRGAYITQERKRAQEMGYVDPIQPNIQATHDNYHKCVDMMLTRIPDTNVMIASHNEKTIRWVVQRMDELKIPKRDGGVFFGQLLGMCDHVSFALGVNGYQAFKYVPYGPIKEVLPYLIRRAEENSGMLGGVGKERKLLWNELMRRRFPMAAVNKK